MHLLMMRKKLIAGWKMTIAGIKHYTETGQPVGTDTRLPVSGVVPAGA